MHPIDIIFEILHTEGGRDYGSTEEDFDRVSQIEHALQCATLAENAGGPSSMIAAALLHDIGHLTNPEDRGAARRGEDAFHESVGRYFLSDWFGPEVTEPVMWHVAAKRYLTATEPDYFSTLSPGSVRSLELQGGPYTEEEAGAFIGRPFAREAVRVRRWDEQAKVPGLTTPPLEQFRQPLEDCLRPR